MPSDSDLRERPAGRYALYVLLVLCLANFFASLDRYAFFVFVEQIKREFQASDTAIGTISGIAFIFFFVVLGIPVARWVDRGNRRNILALSVAAWSIMTMLGGFAGSIVQLGLSRAGLGVGEAGATPAAGSLIADHFPKASRHAAISVFQAGMAFSGIVGAPLVGIIAGHWGWRSAMLAMGGPGILLAALIMLTVREPQRGAMDAPSDRAAAESSLWRSIAAVFRSGAFRWLTFSQIAVGFATGILPVWLPVYLMRRYDMTLAQTGSVSGYLNGVVMLVAFALAGVLLKWLLRRPAGERWASLLPAIAALLAAPLLLAALSVTTLTQVLVLATLFYLLLFATRPSALSLAIDLADSRHRGLATAIVVISNSLFGAGLGTLAVGVISDALSPQIGNVQSLRIAMLLTVLPAMLLCSLAFFFVTRQRSAGAQ